jgi:voltage-gated potassium channel
MVVTVALMLGGMTVMGIFIGTVSASMVTVLTRRLQVSDLELDELADHVVVCGWNPAGPTMLGELFAKGAKRQPVIVITEVGERPSDLLLPGVPPELIYHLTGDYTRVEILESVGIRRASAAILLTDTQTPRADQDRDARTVLAALTIERMAPGIFCCAELINGQHESLLKMAKVEEVVVRDWYAGVIIGSMGRNRGLSRVLNDILSTTDGNAFHKVRVGPGFAGSTIGALHSVLKTRQNAILVSWERSDENGRTLETMVNPPSDMVVQQDDLLVVISNQVVHLK